MACADQYNRNYQTILVLLLRLRQVCSHPALIQENGVTVESEEDNAENWAEDKREELLRARQVAGPEFVSTMKRKMKEDAKQRMEAEKQVRLERHCESSPLLISPCSPLMLPSSSASVTSALRS